MIAASQAFVARSWQKSIITPPLTCRFQPKSISGKAVACFQNTTHVYSKIQRSFATNSGQPHLRVLVVGCNGYLGRAVVSRLGNPTNSDSYRSEIIGVDINPQPQQLSGSNTVKVDKFVQLDPEIGNDLQKLTSRLSSIISTEHEREAKFNRKPLLDVIICTAESFEPSDLTSPDKFSSTMKNMMCTNLFPVLSCVPLALTHLNPTDGLFIAIGATGALLSSPNETFAYGVSKAAVHHTITSLAATTKSTTKGVKKAPRKQFTSIGILPGVLDTPSNRESMPGEKFDSWINPDDIAEEIGVWVNHKSLRPHSGSLIKVFSERKKMQRKGIDGNMAPSKTVFRIAR